MKKEELFYCYSINLFHFLKQRKFFYLCRGVSETSGRVFWAFERTDEFKKALTEYGLNNPNKK